MDPIDFTYELRLLAEHLHGRGLDGQVAVQLGLMWSALHLRDVMEDHVAAQRVYDALLLITPEEAPRATCSPPPGVSVEYPGPNRYEPA